MRVSKIIILLIIAFSFTYAQFRESGKQSGIGIPYFKLAVHQKFNEDLKHTNILVMTEFVHDDLTFVKKPAGGFEARMELVFAIYDDQTNVIASRVINKNIQVANFEGTNSRESRVDIKEVFKLPSGKFRVFVKAEDLNSRKTAQSKQEISITDFADKKINISPILFVQNTQFDNSGRLVDFEPSFGNNFNVKAEKFYIYFDVFTADTSQPVTLQYRLHHKKYPTEVDSTFQVKFSNNVSSFLIHIDRERLRYNQYALEVGVQQGDLSAKQAQIFDFYWSDTPETSEDISVALQQMSYILPNDSLKKYAKAEFEAQRKYFQRFWKNRDPDPTTDQNELKNEYFKRVNYSNRYYKAMGLEGWKTDRGRILIKFGPPDDIERHPFELNQKPYEIWRYYTLRKVFYFIDVSGFGDYRLHPDFLDVEFQ